MTSKSIDTTENATVKAILTVALTVSETIREAGERLIAKGGRGGAFVGGDFQRTRVGGGVLQKAGQPWSSVGHRKRSPFWVGRKLRACLWGSYALPPFKLWVGRALRARRRGNAYAGSQNDLAMDRQKYSWGVGDFWGLGKSAGRAYRASLQSFSTTPSLPHIPKQKSKKHHLKSFYYFLWVNACKMVMGSSAGADFLLQGPFGDGLVDGLHQAERFGLGD